MKKQEITDAAFDIFWAAYPRRVAKGAARKAWDKAVKKAAAGTIMLALEKQKALGVFNVEPCYIPHPSTWLNQERWDDEVAQGRATASRLAAEGTARNYLSPKKDGDYGF